MLNDFKKKSFILILLLTLLAGIHGTDNLSKYRRDAKIQQQTTGNVPPLVRVYNDLSHLVRICNAISLQAHAVEGSVKMREIGSELLGTRLEQLMTLLSTNVTAINSTVKEIFANTVAATNITDMDKKKAALRFLTDNVLKIKAYEGAKNDDLSAYMKIVSEWKANKNKWRFCRGASERIIKTGKVLENAEKIPEVEKKDALADFAKHSDEMIACYREAFNFSEVIKTEVKPEIVKLDQMFNITEFIDGFQRRRPLFDKMSGVFGDLKKEFSKTESFRSILISKQAVQLENVITAQLEGPERATHQDPHYTSGLPNGYSDLLKIKADINSEWFFENVAYSNKTNVRIVEEGLKAFEMFAKEIEVLDDSWKQFTGLSVKPIQMFVESWKQAENYKVNSGIEQSLDDSATSFQKCLALATPADQFKFSSNSFLQTHKQLSVVTKTAQELEKEVHNIMNKVNETKLRAFFKQLKSVTITEDFATDSKAIRKLDDYREFVDFAVTISLTKVHGEKLMSEAAKVNTSLTATEVGKALEDSKLLKVLKCFKDKQFDGEKMDDAIEFLDVAHHLTFYKTIETVLNDYLDALAKLQKAQYAVESVVNSMSDNINKTTWKAQAMFASNISNHAAASQVLGAGLKLLGEMNKTVSEEHLEVIMNVTLMNATVISNIATLATTASQHQQEYQDPAMEIFFKNPKKAFTELIDRLKKLEAFAATTDGSMASIALVFKMASEIRGFAAKKEAMKAMKKELEKNYRKGEADPFVKFISLNLDFSKNVLHSTSTTLLTVKAFFDKIFGKIPGSEVRIAAVTPEPQFPNWAVASICCTIFFLFLLAVFIGYGLTENGRNTYVDTWLYYFPDEKVFERRWRYSHFMDTMNFKNALVDSALEVNPINTLTALKKGAYIHAYSKGGNTALHLATRSGNVTVVEMLLKSGADQTMLNVENKTAEEMIPPEYKKTHADLVDGFEEIKVLLKKLKDKKFRIRVPQVFKTHLFHIFLHRSTDDKLTDMFTASFRAITSEEPLETTTHCICKVDKSGVLETDDMDLLRWIFMGVIMCKESWMTACLENEKNIRRDYEHLIEHVQYNGVKYDNCVLPWSEAQAKGKIPYLYGVYMILTIPDYPNVEVLRQIVLPLGGEFLQSFPDPAAVNVGARPYNLAHLPPIWILHDGSIEDQLAPYRNHPDKLYACFTEQELISLLLKRDVNRDTRKPTIPLSKG